MPLQRKASAFSLWWQSITQPAATLQQSPVDPAPQGAALFGDEQMQALGQALAQAHVLHTGPTRELLLAQLKSTSARLAALLHD